jgi:hypothetical protein
VINPAFGRNLNILSRVLAAPGVSIFSSRILGIWRLPISLTGWSQYCAGFAASPILVIAPRGTQQATAGRGAALLREGLCAVRSRRRTHAGQCVDCNSQGYA